MRRILRVIARGAGRDAQQLGDVSTLADARVVDALVQAHDVQWHAFMHRLHLREQALQSKLASTH